MGSLLVGALDDGFKLWHLLCALCDESLPRLNPPKSDIHKLTNLGVCLDFLTAKRVKLVGIDPHGKSFLCAILTISEILHHNGKLILGLIWTIILTFHMKGSNFGEAKQELVDFASTLGVDTNLSKGYVSVVAG